jgi:hypothetical protein
MASTGRRYTEVQIIAILKEAEAAKSAAEVIRRHGAAPAGRPDKLRVTTTWWPACFVAQGGTCQRF